ncbi:MAG TPA: rod shape-determining protein RodA [Solirubrobacterales bacterium]|nr:rod shape-determining protein RodA [Solirubrobacterales bacterium]
MEAFPHSHPRFDQPRASLLARAGFARLDPLVLVAGIGIILFSIYTLGVATKDDFEGDPYHYAVRQAIYAVIGIAVMLGVARVDYSRYRELRVGIYTAMITAICLVFVFAEATRGTRGWIELPFFRFQPSELGKVLLVVSLAAFALDTARRSSDGVRTIRLLALGACPAGLVLLQPDLGTALVYGAVTLAIMFVAGVKWQHFAIMGTVAASVIAFVLVIAPALGTPILKDYQQDRLTAFLNPSDDPADSSYQINQSLIAVGSGGKTGRGDEATQTSKGFLPERHTDFIFAVVGERFGFLGAAFLLSLFALLIWRALRIMTLSKNFFGTLIAGGIAAMLMFHILVNVGMNIGIMPITGIPLPLMSYGGSSVIATFLALGLLQSIYAQAQLSSKRGQISL